MIWGLFLWVLFIILKWIVNEQEFIMKFSSLLVACVALGMSGGAWAKTSVEEQFVQKLSACDGSLFKFIHANQKSLKKYAPINHKNGIAHFKTEGDGERKEVTFKKPMMVGGVAFTGFYEEHMELPLGFPAKKESTIDIYFWGLTTQESASQVAKNLPSLALTAQSSGHWAGKTWIIDDASKSSTWKINENAVGGTVPVKGSVEKVLMLEEYQGKTALSCTIQGYVNDKIVHAIRPDLKGE